MGTVPWSIGSQQAGLQTHVLPLPALEIQDRVPGNRRKPRQSWGWTGCPLPRRPSPSGCLAVPLLSLRKAREPTCLWEGLECPPTWSRNSAQTPEKAYSMDCKRRDICFSFGSEGKQMGKGNWWKDVGAAERLRPHTRSLQVNTSELPLEVFLQGMPYFSFFLSFFLSFFFFFFFLQREETSAVGPADLRARGWRGGGWALRNESCSPQLLQNPGGKQQIGIQTSSLK